MRFPVQRFGSAQIVPLEMVRTVVSPFQQNRLMIPPSLPGNGGAARGPSSSETGLPSGSFVGTQGLQSERVQTADQRGRDFARRLQERPVLHDSEGFQKAAQVFRRMQRARQEGLLITLADFSKRIAALPDASARLNYLLQVEDHFETSAVTSHYRRTPGLALMLEHFLAREADGLTDLMPSAALPGMLEEKIAVVIARAFGRACGLERRLDVTKSLTPELQLLVADIQFAYARKALYPAAQTSSSFDAVAQHLLEAAARYESAANHSSAALARSVLSEIRSPHLARAQQSAAIAPPPRQEARPPANLEEHIQQFLAALDEERREDACQQHPHTA